MSDTVLARAGRLRFHGFWTIVGFGFVLLVVYLSLAPSLPDFSPIGGQKVGHALAYAWLMTWFAQLQRPVGRRIAIAIACCGLGVAMEYAQSMTDYRHFAYTDMLINAGGVCIGFLLAFTPLQYALHTFESILRVR